MSSQVLVCIPIYNAESTIEDTLNSLVSQTYTDMQILLSDNCSTDSTLVVLKPYENEHMISLLSTGKNIGGEGNFERCLSLGEKDYKAIYHADDVYEDDIVEKQVKFLEANKNCGVVLTRANFINDKGDIIGHSKTFKQLAINAETGLVIFDVVSLIKKLMRYGNFLITPSAMFRSDVAKNKIKTWNATDFGTSADLDVWLRAAETVGLGVLEDPLINYRLSHKQGGYNYNKHRVIESDFIKVMKFWVEKSTVKPHLKKSDHYYFKGLIKIDRLLCGVRAYLCSNNQLGCELLRNVFHWSYCKKFRLQYFFLWILSWGLRCGLTRMLFKPILKQMLFKKYLG